MQKKFWNSYGAWDEIAKSDDINFVMSRITGKPVEKWRVNHLSDTARAAMATVIGEGVIRQGPSLGVLDFGCGVGRNAGLLKTMYGRVYGCDIPEMLEQIKGKDPIKARDLYEGFYTSLQDAFKDNTIHTLYDSVVFQHIIDADFNAAAAEAVHSHESLDCHFSLTNKSVGETLLIKQLKSRGWKITHEEVDVESFLGSPHIVYIMRRPG